MPVLPPYQRGKESTGILTTDYPGMLGKREKGQPITFTSAEEVLLLCFLTEGKEAVSALQVFGNDVAERGRRKR
jgi:hypothetical protein